MPVDISNFIRGLGDARQRALAAAQGAVDRFGERIIGQAQRLTPVKTGALQASGTTAPAELKGESIDKTIGFNTNYAAAVHERLDANHAQGQSKFLETAMQQEGGKFSGFVGGQVKAALGGGSAGGE